MKWYIGQPIVAIANHTQCAFKKGQEFEIKNIQQLQCKHIVLDIGIRGDGDRCRCGLCKFVYHSGTTWWFNETSFAPLDVDISELTDILKEPIKELTT